MEKLEIEILREKINNQRESINDAIRVLQECIFKVNYNSSKYCYKEYKQKIDTFNGFIELLNDLKI